MEEGDFFDEISSRIDSLKAPSENPEKDDEVVEVELGSTKPSPKKKGLEPDEQKPAKRPSKSTAASPRRRQSKTKRHPPKRSTKKTSSADANAANNLKKKKIAAGRKKAPAKAAAQGEAIPSGAESKRGRAVRKSPPSKQEQQKAAPKKTKTGGSRPSKKIRKAPKNPKLKSSTRKNPVQPGVTQNEGGLNFDDFLADVAADIENVKDRFETADAGASGGEIVEYDMDEWVLPEEQDQTEPVEAAKVQKHAPQKKSKQKAVPRGTDGPKGKPPVQNKSPLTRSAPKKSPALKKLTPLPTIQEMSPTAPKEVVKKKPTPKATTAGSMIQNSATARAGATKKPPPPPPHHLFDDLQEPEDFISRHLVKEAPRRTPRRRSTKPIVVGGLIVVILLAAGVVYLQDPFGMFTPAATPPTAAEKMPPKQAEPSKTHKVKQPPSSPPVKPQEKPVWAGKTPDSTANKPIPIETPKPKPAPVTGVAGAQPPHPASRTDTLSSQPVKQEIPVSEPRFQNEPSLPPPAVGKEPPPTKPEKRVAPPTATLVQKKATPAPDLETPNVTVPEPNPTTRPLHEQVTAFLGEWASAWEKTAGPNGDFTAYMACYSDSFLARGMNKAAWQKDKQTKNSRKKWIAIEIRDVSIVQQGSPNRVKVTFSQGYRSSNYSSTSPKTLVLTKEPRGWKIIGVSP